MEYVITSAQKVLAQAARFGGPRELLSQPEMAASERFRNPADGLGYAAAHIVFRVMAARALGGNLRNVRGLAAHRLCRSCGGPHGKPVIEGSNLSLSRVRDMVLVASAATGQPLGADLEAFPRQLHSGFDAFALSPVEREALSHTDVESRIRLWVAKEAALKATGHGLAVEPDALCLGGLPPPAPHGTTASCWAAVVDSPLLGETHGMEIAWVPAGDNHAAALATSGQPAIREMDIREVFQGS
ncbi:4'-phosphopantetheinyl transferase superfamily protein [Arthrobacter sp. H35-D1]|uniref:4'-phosphopantetheinyl transferase family protein n=1 Tax=Arthrobacter sp. H35-D1 TaxID=3046202 RepID=UPI0024BA0D3F|nr:4'-phosphopantetheinyl transferase superfamily protein [Arthrobacter sp. H35-D1]MDJ0314391.1 4'-phosphopantetheinyl transferase superfamily protein [Arthrobacter sp. H35-D1]